MQPDDHATPSVFLTGRWMYLAMLNYEVEHGILQPLVPFGTELDSWNGRSFISVVGFLFLDTRVFGCPIPFHRNFEEVNLRFYVRRKAVDGWRRGVVFIKELVPRFAIAATARVLYNENYYAVPMRHSIELEGGKLKSGGSVEYGWKVNREWNFLRVKTTGDYRPLISGSEEEFITEHYWGYAAQRNGRSMEYQVEHPRWLVRQADESVLHCDVAAVYGKKYVDALSRKADSAFVAEGSAIVVRKGIKI